MRSFLQSHVSRRSLIKGGLAAAVGLALGERAMAADATSLPLITKSIPSSGEKLPVVGVGTNAYGVTTPEDIAARREVLEALSEVSGSVVDTARGYGESEVVIGQLLAELGNRGKLFIATKTPMGGDMSNGAAVLQDSFNRLRVDRVDLMQVHNFHGLDELMPVFQEWKQAGKIRYVGVTTSMDGQYPQMTAAMQKYPLDFIQVDYSIGNRDADDEILPLARDKGMAVLVNMPLGGRRGNLLPKVAGKPLPDWASEIDVTSWAQYLLKYIIGHPTVTCVIPGMTKLAHLQDNLRAGRGRLPDAPTRKRMEEYWESL
jgi:aryl-alcohol dehydrogenase-like predicted oxidoreductase